MNDTITIREKPRSEESNRNASIHQISINILEKQQQPLSRIAVVIPTRNNELTIGSIVLLAHQHAGHVIVVDDASNDRTIDIAQQAGAVVIPAGYTGGRVNAILTGCRHALGYSCTTVVFLDVTGSHLIRDIPRLTAPVLAGEADLVIGSRNLMGRKGIHPYLFDEAGNNHTPPNTCRCFTIPIPAPRSGL